MGWTILRSGSAQSKDKPPSRLRQEGQVHIIKVEAIDDLGIVHDFKYGRELGRITTGPWGAKLEAIELPLSIAPTVDHNPAKDPHLGKYELQPSTPEHSEAILLRHGDSIYSSLSNVCLTCTWEPSEVQVNSSAVSDLVDVGMVDAVQGVTETPEEDTEDEAADNTVATLGATQEKSRPPRATPKLSNQASVVVQETPTTARVVEDITKEHPHITQSLDEVDPATSEQYSTARTGESQHATSTTLFGPFANSPQRRHHPTVLVPKKRHSPSRDDVIPDDDKDIAVHSKKRYKRVVSSDPDTQDSVQSNIAVQENVESVVTARGPRKKAEAQATHTSEESNTPRSQRASQRSTPASETYDGPTPCVALSNSSLNASSAAVKKLKKMGGTLIETVKGNFNILCIRDGVLQKTAKVLRAIAIGVPIVTEKWLLDSAKADHFLSVSSYQPSIPEQESEWNFSLTDVLGHPQKPFDGHAIYFTSKLQSNYKAFAEIEQVCMAAGATKVNKKKFDGDKNTIVLAADDGDAEKFAQDDITCYNRDLLPVSIFRGSLDLDSDEFKIVAGKVTADGEKENKKKRARKS